VNTEQTTPKPSEPVEEIEYSQMDTAGGTTPEQNEAHFAKKEQKPE